MATPACLPIPKNSGFMRRPLAAYSGGTVRDLHPLSSSLASTTSTSGSLETNTYFGSGQSIPDVVSPPKENVRFVPSSSAVFINDASERPNLQERRKQPGRPGRVDLRDEHVECEPGGLNRIGQRKVARVGAPCNVGVSGLVDRDGIRVVNRTASQIGGIHKSRRRKD